MSLSEPHTMRGLGNQRDFYIHLCNCMLLVDNITHLLGYFSTEIHNQIVFDFYPGLPYLLQYSDQMCMYIHIYKCKLMF